MTFALVTILAACPASDGKDDRLFELCDDDLDGFVEAECKGSAPDLSSDCDDTDPEVSPDAEEVCNGVDDNCDGVADEGDVQVFADGDGDGYGNPDAGALRCGPGDGWSLVDTDCHDANSSVNVNGSESCNGLDDDCNGTIDDNSSDAHAYYEDVDQDTYGDAKSTSLACTPPAGFVDEDTDCDDADGAVNPVADELCAVGDEDCDGLDGDEDPGTIDLTTWYPDSDGDGFGNGLATPITSCEAPPDHASVAEDCDDDAFGTHPDAVEVCDSKDQDCDGVPDDGVLLTFWVDGDNDGYGVPTGSITGCSPPTGYVLAGAVDCADTSPDWHPNAFDGCVTLTEMFDQDCDGLINEDDPSCMH